ncbi:MAG: sensor histidine kinase [Lachnospira sp.]
MNDFKSFIYVKNELEKYKIERNSLLENKRAISFEISTIKKKISSLEKKADHTGDVFHSGNYVDSQESTDNVLNNNIALLSTDIENIESRLSEIDMIISNLNDIIDSDEKMNSSVESCCSDNLSENIFYDNSNPVNVINLCELDRARIARDIHDSVVQDLTALIHKQEFISRLVDNDLQRAKFELNYTKSNLKQCVEELRNIIYDLRPMILEDLGFKATFIDLCEHLNSNSDINYEYNFDTSIDDYSIIPQAIQMTVFRIIRELSSNSEKHSGCSTIRVSLLLNKNNLVLNFFDDGTGFDFEDSDHKRDNKKYGIRMLKERVALLNGSISYFNVEGSSYDIVIPY